MSNFSVKNVLKTRFVESSISTELKMTANNRLQLTNPPLSISAFLTHTDQCTLFACGFDGHNESDLSSFIIKL